MTGAILADKMFPGMAFASRVSGFQKGAAMAPHPLSHPDVALNLALAVVASSTAPLLLLDGDLTLVAASKSFCRAFGIDAASVPDKPLRELGAGEWNVPQLNLPAEGDGRRARPRSRAMKSICAARPAGPPPGR